MEHFRCVPRVEQIVRDLCRTDKRCWGPNPRKHVDKSLILIMDTDFKKYNKDKGKKKAFCRFEADSQTSYGWEWECWEEEKKTFYQSKAAEWFAVTLETHSIIWRQATETEWLMEALSHQNSFSCQHTKAAALSCGESWGSCIGCLRPWQTCSVQLQAQ